MMFLIVGWGKQTSKDLAKRDFDECRFCHKGNLRLREVTFWISLFFIPIIPYKTKYYLSCNNCNYGYEISQELAERMQDKEEEDRYY
ncbi:MAG: zinc-ribbon domain-containing protein [Promethearchaeota archaeon]